MAAEPLVIYSHTIDPAGVLELLRDLSPGLEVTGAGAAWQTVTISEPRGFLRARARISFTHSPDYYVGPDWPRQLQGMVGYFARFPRSEITARVLSLLPTLRFALSVHPQPSPDLVLGSDDPRLRYLYAVAKHLDGVIFSPSALRDAAGRILLHAGEPPDPDAVLPAVRVDAPPLAEWPRYAGGTAPNPPSPPAERVALRALALGAVSWRCMLEREQAPARDLEKERVGFVSWVDGVGLGAELEPDEWALLKAPVGQLPEDAMRAEWRIEGAGVLAWALGRFELPPFDEQVDVARLGRTLGLATVERARQFLAGATLRAMDDIDTLARQLLGIHWRLREHEVQPGKKEFQHSSQDAWFGKLPLDGLRFIDGDLAIGPYAVSDAPDDVLGPCHLAVQERHHAINWLCGDSPVYSEVDTPT